VRAIQVVAATYPNGSVGYVTVITKPWDTSLEKFVKPGLPNASDDLDWMYRFGRGFYHKQIGTAYSLDDMVDTFYLPESEEEFAELAGERILATEGLPFHQRPETVMVNP
jgi:hypothetical protein